MPNFLARATLDLMLLRRGPQDLPARMPLLWAIIGLFVAMNALAYSLLLNISTVEAILQAASGLAYLAGFVWVVLAFTGRRARFLQTFMAFVLTGILFNILEIGPLSSLLPHFLQMQELVQQAQNSGGQVDEAALQAVRVPGVPMVLLLLGYVWRLMVMAHIFHHALEVSRGRAMAITLMFPALIMFLVLVLR